MARRKRANKLSIIYKRGDVKIVYVPRATEDLLPEAKRIHVCVSRALRTLRLLRRTRHAAIKAAIWQLEQLPPPTKDMTDTELVTYIGVTSYTMEDTLGLLGELKTSKIDELQAARFQLTYGQTPKKRDRDDTMCTKSRRYAEPVDDA